MALPTLARERARPSLELQAVVRRLFVGPGGVHAGNGTSRIRREHAGFGFSVLATDISTRVLEQAQAGIYPEQPLNRCPWHCGRVFAPEPKPRRRLDPNWPELRAKVRFGRLNFMEKNYGLREEFDMIFFRNVMIYFEKPTQQAVVNRLCRNLRPGGYLFISHSESLTGLDVPLRPVGNSVFRKTR